MSLDEKERKNANIFYIEKVGPARPFSNDEKLFYNSRRKFLSALTQIRQPTHNREYKKTREFSAHTLFLPLLSKLS